MAYVTASRLPTDSPAHSIHVTSPSSHPTWAASHRNLISTHPSFAGFTTTWTCDGATRLSVSTSHRPHATCLAYFPPLNPLGRPHRPPSRTASLVVSAFRFVTIATPSSDPIQTPLGDPLTDPNPALQLFTPPHGIILRTLHPPYYHYLSHPLHPPVPLSLPDGHTLLYAFADVPLLITRAASTLTIWSVHPLESLATDNPDHHLNHPVIPSLTLSLSKCHVTPIHPTLPTSAFLSHDARGLLNLCILSDSVLTGFSIEHTASHTYLVKPSFRIRDATSAIPVLAVRRHHHSLDILIRHSDATHSLFMGRNRLCAVNLPSATDISGHRILAQPVADEFSLLDSSAEGPRFSLRHTAFSSALVAACLAALSFAFERAGAIRRITAVYHDLLAACARPTLSSVSTTHPDHEWLHFEQILLRAAVPPSTPVSDPMETDSPQQSPMRGHDDDAWHLLLRSEFHTSHPLATTFCSSTPPPHKSSLTQLERTTDLPSSAPDADLLRQILHALHLLYEDRKLNTLSHRDCLRLARLNCQLATALGTSSFVAHYCRDFPELVDSHLNNSTVFLSSNPSASPVPSIVDFLAAKVHRAPSRAMTYPAVSFDDKLARVQPTEWTASWRNEIPFELTRRVIAYYAILFEENPTKGKGEDVVRDKSEGHLESQSKNGNTRHAELLLAMVRDGFSVTDLDALPFGIALPLRDALWKCRQDPCPDWPYAAFALIGREDLFNFADFDADPNALGEDSLALIRESRALLHIQAAAAASAHSSEPVDPDSNRDEDGKGGSYEKDKLYLDDKGDGCDLHGSIFRLRFRKDKRIDEVRRILRSTDFIIMTPVQAQSNDNNVEFDIVAEQKRKLELLLRKRFAAPIGRGAFTLRTFMPSDPTKPLSVPKICLSGKIFAQKGAKVTYSPTDPVRLQWGEFHNGVAAGLRIVAADLNKESETGQILTRSWIVNHRPSDTSGSSTHAGMLLALGLGGYLPALRKTDYYQYLVPRHELTAIGLMLGLSAGNVGSMDEKITKMLCLHIRPFNETGFAVPDFHISVNVQTAAVLGLGLLHQGSCENFLLEGLFSELSRRPKPGDLVDDREGLSLAAGFSIGLICLGHGKSAFDAADRRRIDRLLLYANGGSMDKLPRTNGHHETFISKSDSLGAQDRPNANLAESETSRVKEGSFVNTDAVSPGALMALTLIYMKTNDKRLADRLVIPDTLYSLDRARPDHVYLRLVARSLIMWDSIEASPEWIRKSLPPLLLPVNERNDPFDLTGKVILSESYYEYDVDLQGILHARAFSIAGLCTAIALKYAGTNDPRAVSMLMEECVAFERALVGVAEANESAEWVYITGLCSAALSLSVVAAGSGAVDIFRLLRRLRKRRGLSVDHGRYGMHIAMHMAIGFLFLGGGCQTFGTSNIGLVGLLCAIYPQLPRDVNDNQYHLQALRHLYVLATEPRCIETRDVDTGASCCVDVEVRLKNGECIETQAPCIVAKATDIRELAVVGERYLGRTVEINPAAAGRGWYSGSRRQVIFVKRKTGHLPYTADPQGAKGIVARCVTRPRPQHGDKAAYVREIGLLVRAFSADPDILAFVEYFCSGSDADVDAMAGRQARHVEMLYDCLAQDKAEAVKVHLDARRATDAARSGDLSLAETASLAVGEAYALSGRTDTALLVRPGFLASVVGEAWAAVDCEATRSALLRYVNSGAVEWPVQVEVRRRLAAVLRLTGIGSACAVGDLAGTVRRACAQSTSDAAWVELGEASVRGLGERGMEVVARAIEEAMGVGGRDYAHMDTVSDQLTNS